MTTLEEGYRALATPADVHDIDEKRHQVAVDFPHEVMDSYRTDWGRGCWSDSFAKRLPVMLANHNPEHLIGRALRAEELGPVARVVGQFSDFDDVPKAKEAFANVRDGIYPGWSFHYRNGVSIQHPNVRNARRYTKADMLEFSPVVFPSIPGADTVGIRSQARTSDVSPDIAYALEILDRRTSGGYRELELRLPEDINKRCIYTAHDAETRYEERWAELERSIRSVSRRRNL